MGDLPRWKIAKIFWVVKNAKIFQSYEKYKLFFKVVLLQWVTCLGEKSKDLQVVKNVDFSKWSYCNGRLV